MRARALVTLLIGLPLACAALAFLDQRLSEREGAPAVTTESTVAVATVVVAARDLAPGDLLRADALEEIAWPADAVPDGAFASIDELLDAGSEERRARHAILSGEPVLATKIYGFRDHRAPGKREVAPATQEARADATVTPCSRNHEMTIAGNPTLHIAGVGLCNLPLQLVLNRLQGSFGWGTGVERRQAVEALGRAFDRCIADQFDLLISAANRGTPALDARRYGRFGRQVQALLKSAMRQLAAQPTFAGAH